MCPVLLALSSGAKAARAKTPSKSRAKTPSKARTPAKKD